jgi:hypothetical protein
MPAARDARANPDRYPPPDDFVTAKRRYDPQLRFRNAPWDSCFA